MNFTLIYIVVIGFFVVIGLGALVLKGLEPAIDREIQKTRLAAAILTGVLVFMMVVIIMYYAVDPVSAGEKIFDTVLPFVSLIIGTLLGYFFGAGKKPDSSGSDLAANAGKKVHPQLRPEPN